MAEAVGLVNSLHNWTVVDKIILSTKTPEKKRIFGKGNFQSLTGMICCVFSTDPAPGVSLCDSSVLCASSERIRRTAGVTAVFVNVERLSPLSEVSPSLHQRPTRKRFLGADIVVRFQQCLMYRLVFYINVQGATCGGSGPRT